MTDLSSTRCYVLGLETQIGLSLVRELGAAGVTVIGIAQDETALGLRSRYLSHAALLHSPRTPQGLAELRAIGERFGPGTLLAVSEANLQWLMDEREALGVLSPVLPDAEAFAIVLDKTRTLDAARAVGIEVPETASPVSWAEVEQLAIGCRFPVVLKWADPAKVAGRLAELGLPLEKAEHIYSAEQLIAACARYRPLGQWPVVQEYCAGTGLGQFFFMHRGQAVRRFQHLRIAEWPPEGGFSSVCDAVPLDQHRDLQERSIALLQRIGWHGVAMVEYRHDSATGRSVLMEINGRFWGSYPLALHAGAGFALISHAVQAGAGAAHAACAGHALAGPHGGDRTQASAAHPAAAAQDHRPAVPAAPLQELSRFVTDYFRPAVCYYVWSWRDPRPFLQDMRNLLRRH
ncbi:hypothetical protein PEC18_33830 [Paucibacter sp. O1-1]|nr:hypothetical protein [Paucibacter sp. O1-1]MDA3830674.1 hypothetical protein [Paucibacter sp. O1-1]